MIVVKVEVWPGGDRSRARELGCAEIENVIDDGDVAHYVARDEAAERATFVRGHVRADGWRPLVAKALGKLWGSW